MIVMEVSRREKHDRDTSYRNGNSMRSGEVSIVEKRKRSIGKTWSKNGLTMQFNQCRE